MKNILSFKLLFFLFLFTYIQLNADTGDSCSSAENVSFNNSLDTKLEHDYTIRNNHGEERTLYYYYYYKFTPSSNGTVEISSTELDSDTDAWLYENIDTCNAQNSDVASDTSWSDNITLSYDVIGGNTYYLPLRNYTNDEDEFILNINFTADITLPIEESTADICYQNPIEAGTRTITPINSISDITDVVVYFDTSSLMDVLSNGKDIDACSVDDGELWANCEEEDNGIDIGNFSIFNSGGWSFSLGDITPDENRSISTYDEVGYFPFFNNFLSQQGSIQTTYVKDGVQYIGSMSPCDETAPDISDQNITIQNSVKSETNILTVTSSEGAVTGYSIDSGNSEGFFDIDEYGNIITKTDMINATTDIYTLVVTATNDTGSDSATITINITEETIYHEGARDFILINPIDTQNIIGNTQIIGNTVECVTTTQTTSSSDYSNLTCNDTVGDYNNNNYIVKYIDIDNDSTTYNSSSAIIEFPSTFKEIAWVGLYWQAHINDTSYISTNEYSDDMPSGGIEETTANQVLLKIGTGSYQNVNAQTIDYFSGSYFNNDYARYSAFANITDKFIDNNTLNTNIEITVANITATQGKDSGLGNYGAWTLVVVYKEDELNSLSKLRNNSVYSGYQYVSSNSGDQEIILNDFLLPKNGTIDSQMAVFAAEGEYRYDPDSMELDGTALGDPDKDNVFDARLSDSITRTPSMTNNNGIDIDVFDTSAIMTTKRDSDPNAVTYNATITLSSRSDLYYPSMVSFTTELYKPRVCYYIGSITDSQNVLIYDNAAFVNGQTITAGKNYTFNFWISNMKKDFTDSDIEIAEKVQIYFNTSDFTYSTNSTEMNNIDGINVAADRNYIAVTDTDETNTTGTLLKDDLGERVGSKSTWRIGNGASNLEGGQLAIANDFEDTRNITFITLDGALNIKADQEFNLIDYFEFKASFQTSTVTIGEDNAQFIVQCQDLNTTGSLVAPIGAFNIVQQRFNTTIDPIESTALENQLPTQVSGRPIDIKIVSLDTDFETLVPYSGDLNISIINTPHYIEGDEEGNQLKCNEADPLSGTLTTVTLENSSWKNFTITNTTLAIKNASYKISYDLNETTRKHVCSRDVFAIRPDKFIFTPPASEDIELLKSGALHNFTLKALQYNSTAVTQYYNVSNITQAFFNLTPTIYLPDGSLGSDLGGTLSFAGTSFNIQNGISNNSGTNDVVAISFSDVGLVNIKIEDQNWSQVDIDNGDTPLDCTSNGAYICGDINATFIPDHFTLSEVHLKNKGNQKFTYISNDLNMSAGIDVALSAKNSSDLTTQNFKIGAWENPVNIDFTLPTLTDMAQTKNAIIDTINLGFTDGSKTINYDETNRSKNLIFNYARSVNGVINPFKIDGADVNVMSSSTYTSSSGNSVTITGVLAADENVTFIYGRTHATRHRFSGETGTATIYYESYCSGTVSSNTCDKKLLPNGTLSTSIDDPRWFINSLHNASISGSVDTVVQKGNPGIVTVNPSSIVSNQNYSVTLNYTEAEDKGYPYKTTMENKASSWLIYNKYDAADTTNEFSVEFINPNSNWSGIQETSTTTQTNATEQTNRRTMW